LFIFLLYEGESNINRNFFFLNSLKHHKNINILAFSQHTLTSTALPLSLSLSQYYSSHFREPHKWFKEPQSLKRNRELYFEKLSTQNSLNTATDINSKGKSFLFISSIFSPRLYRFPRSAALKAEWNRR